MFEAISVALLTGACSGLVTFGALTVHLKWLRADVNEAKGSADYAHRRINALLHRETDPAPLRRATDKATGEG